MSRLLENDLPGFRTFNPFFAELREPFEPVACGEPEKRAYVRALAALHGRPAHLFRQVREDIALTAVVREVRRYGGDRTFVRFEFTPMGAHCVWGDPVQLMVVFDELGNIVRYTVLRGRGLHRSGIVASMTRTLYDWENYTDTEDLQQALDFLGNETTPEVAFSDQTPERHFLYVYGGKGVDGRMFDVEWYLANAPWLLTAKAVGLDEVERIVSAVRDGGDVAAGESADWRQFDFERNYRESGALFEIDRELRRMLERAKRDGDEIAEKTIRTVGIDERYRKDPFSIRVPFGSGRAMMNSLYSQTVVKGGLPEARKSRLVAYLALRGHVWSQHYLGYRLHFGCGIKVDYPLAVHWHERAARKGDAYAMQSLGVIFTEKDSPVWDGPKGIAWFEKAVACGETHAMGSLGNCLLCGRCIAKDASRAAALLKKAVAAHPDMKNYRRNLKKALRQA